MKRKAHALMLLAALGGGCVTTEKTDSGQTKFGQPYKAREVPAAQGPWGDPVAVRAGEKPNPTKNSNNGVKQAVARSDMDSGVKHAVVRDAKKSPGDIVQTHEDRMVVHNPGQCPVPGAVAALGALTGPAAMNPSGGRSSVRFVGPNGMKVAWFAPGTGPGNFTPAQVEAPGRYNFPQGGIYRLKLTDLPNRPGVELYPTLQVYPASNKTAEFLAHSAVPVGFTEEDFEQVAAGNYVVKVVYLPDPQFQDLATAGPDEVVSSRLEPGVDPIAEAMRRGSILLVIRMGNIDLEAPNTPALNMPPNNMMGQPQLPPGGMLGQPQMAPGGPAPTTKPMPAPASGSLIGPAGRSSVIVPGDDAKTPGRVTASIEGSMLRMK